MRRFLDAHCPCHRIRLPGENKSGKRHRYLEHQLARSGEIEHRLFGLVVLGDKSLASFMSPLTVVLVDGRYRLVPLGLVR